MVGTGGPAADSSSNKAAAPARRAGAGATGAGAATTLRSFLPRGGPAIAMGITSLIALGAVVYSHDSQVRDRESMKAGVQRDKDRMRRKRKEKQQLEQQREQENEKETQ